MCCELPPSLIACAVMFPKPARQLVSFSPLNRVNLLPGTPFKDCRPAAGGLQVAGHLPAAHDNRAAGWLECAEWADPCKQANV